MQIGFIGAPGAGKDALADFFVREKGFNRFAFADRIKEEFYAFTGYTEEEFKAARNTPLEQELRNELWAYSAEQTKKDKLYFISPIVRAIQETTGSVVITDVRTELELRTIEIHDIRPILILRNYKEELKGEHKFGIGKVIPGTKILVSRAIEFPIFWNDTNSLEETYINLEKFYQELADQEIEEN